MPLECIYKEINDDNEIYYSCKIKYQNIKLKVKNIIGKHLPGKTNADIRKVLFVNCHIPKIPTGLTKIFPNMDSLSIYNSNLKYICKDDIKEYRGIKCFQICDNKLEFLPGDLFDGFDLERIRFNDNKLKMIDPLLLDMQQNLNVFDISGNKSYTKYYSVYDLENSDKSMQAVKGEIWKVYRNNHEKYENLKTEYESGLKSLETNLKNLEESSESEDEDIQHKIPYKLKFNLTKDIKNFIKMDNFKDFYILIDGHQLHVHKFLLSARSPTFAEILQNNPEVENLNLVDISVEIFEVILKFLYKDELPATNKTNFMHLLAAAGKLKIEDLMGYAAANLKKTINEDNAVDILLLSNKYDRVEIRKKSFEKIKEKYPKINFKDEWELDPEKVIKIIEHFKKKEEAIKLLEEEFEKIMMNE